MKKLLLLSLCVLSGSLLFLNFSPASEKVDLRWKLKQGEVLQYETQMNTIEATEIDFDGIFGSKAFDDVKNKLKEVEKDILGKGMITSLSRERANIIDIAMRVRADKESEPTSTEGDSMQAFKDLMKK